MRDPEDSRFNNKVDIWAFGCVMWEMIFGKRLFNNDGAVMLHAFSNTPISLPPLPVCESQEINEILKTLSNILVSFLQIEFDQRPKATEVGKILTDMYNLCEFLQ